MDLMDDTLLDWGPRKWWYAMTGADESKGLFVGEATMLPCGDGMMG